MQNKFYFHVLKGKNSHIYINVDDSVSYSVSNDLQQDIYIDETVDFNFNFMVNNDGIIFNELNTSLILDQNKQEVVSGKIYVLETHFSINETIFFISTHEEIDYSSFAEKSQLESLVDDILIDNEVDLLSNDFYDEKPIAKKISLDLLTTKLITYSKKFWALVLYLNEILGMWLYIIGFSVIFMMVSLTTFLYQYEKSKQETMNLEQTLKIKQEINELIINLPAKFQGVFLLAKPDGNSYEINGVVVNQNDLNELKKMLSGKFKNVMLSYNVRLFSDIKKSILGIMAQYKIYNPQVNIQNSSDINIELKGIAENSNDIDNLMIDLRNNLTYIDKVNTDGIVLQSTISKFFDNIPENVRDQLSIKYDLPHGTIFVEGLLIASDIKKLEDNIHDFNNKYNGLLVISYNLQNILKSLPFYITEIHFSEPKFIVTNDGNIIYIGGNYKGVTLLDVTESKVKLFKKFAIALDNNDIMALAMKHNVSNYFSESSTIDKGDCGRTCIINNEKKAESLAISKEKNQLLELENLNKVSMDKKTKIDLQNSINNIKDDLNSKEHEFNYYNKEKVGE